MFCKNCGNQIPDGVAFCAACGTPVTAAPAAPVAPVAPEAAYGYAAAAPAAPAAPAGNAFVAFFTRLWAGIKAFVLSAKTDKNALIKLIAIICAAVIVLGLMIALLAGSSAKSVAKKYVKAQIEGDRKAMYGLMVGKMQKYMENEVWDDNEDEMFDYMEEACDEEDIDVKINNWNQYYKAAKKLNKAHLNEEFGKGYNVTIEIREVENLRPSELEEIQEGYDDEDLEDYVNPDKIKKGKKITVKVIIDGKESTEAEDVVVYVVKYGSSWKVASM